MLDEMVQLRHWLEHLKLEKPKMHGGKVTLAFVYIKELRNISAGHFIKHKPPISEECRLAITIS